MRLLSLLFDPRGAIDRRAFWSGLVQLTIVCLMTYAGLVRLEMAAGLAALPVAGDAFVASVVAGAASQARFPELALAVGIGVAAARLYVTACLMLKRARDAGRSARPLIAWALASLAVHGLMGLWTYDLFDDGMAVIVPLAVDAAATAALGLIFTVWTGALRSRRVKPAS